MKIAVMIDRIFGIVIPLCLIANLVVAWHYLSCPCSEESPPLRLRLRPTPRQEKPPPRWRLAAGSDEPAGGCAEEAPRFREVKGTRGESSGRHAPCPAKAAARIPPESALPGAQATRGPRADTAAIPGEPEWRPYPRCASTQWRTY
jgi:hypothetical protein